MPTPSHTREETFWENRARQFMAPHEVDRKPSHLSWKNYMDEWCTKEEERLATDRRAVGTAVPDCMSAQ